MPKKIAKSAKDNPGVIFKPPFLYLSSIIVGILLQVNFPLELPQELIYIGIFLVFAGLLTFILSVREFKMAKTDVRPSQPTTAIVKTGPYRFSRNPIYLSFTAIQIGLSLWTKNAWLLLLLVPVLAIMNQGVIGREEKYLERKFGKEYLTYKKSIRRWV